MKIRDEDLYHGAVLAQIADAHPFTAINAYKGTGEVSRSAYVINNDIGLYVKYASVPNHPYSEYVFNYSEENLEELESLDLQMGSVFACHVCLEVREICAVPYIRLRKLISARKKAGGSIGQYNVLITAKEGEQFRVYVNAPGTKEKVLGKFPVPRNAFPSLLFK